MGLITERLDKITTPDEEGIEALYALFRSIKDYEIPIVRKSVYVGESFIRQRNNVKGCRFTNISELSYPPASMTKMGRANIDGNPLFYACSFPLEVNERNPIPRYTSVLETSNIIWDRNMSGIERATISRWKVVKELDLIALPFIGEYSKPCSELIEVVKMWQLKCIGSIPKDALELMLYMAREIAKEFTESWEYFKIANFVYYLLYMNMKTNDADGIIYPSVATQGAGLNVALKPCAVDNKLKFSNASICHVVKRGNDAKVFTISDLIVDEYGLITYKDKKLEDDNSKDNYLELSKDLNFIN